MQRVRFFGVILQVWQGQKTGTMVHLPALMSDIIGNRKKNTISKARMTQQVLSLASLTLIQHEIITGQDDFLKSMKSIDANAASFNSYLNFTLILVNVSE